MVLWEPVLAQAEKEILKLKGSFGNPNVWNLKRGVLDSISSKSWDVF